MQGYFQSEESFYISMVDIKDIRSNIKRYKVPINHGMAGGLKTGQRQPIFSKALDMPLLPADEVLDKQCP